MTVHQIKSPIVGFKVVQQEGAKSESTPDQPLAPALQQVTESLARPEIDRKSVV